MKTIARSHCEIIPILSKPGLYIVATQYCAGGAIHSDDNGGKGYTEDEAVKITSRIQVK